MLNNIVALLGTGAAASTTSYESIATVTVGAGGSSSITFSSIPSTYKHLQIRYIARNSTRTSATYGSLVYQINGSYGARYHYLEGTGAAVSAGSGIPSGGEAYMLVAPGTGATSGVFGAGIIDILDYADTNKNKTIRTLSGVDNNGSGEIIFGSSMVNATTAITSFTILPTDGGTGIPQYSHFALYGVKG